MTIEALEGFNSLRRSDHGGRLGGSDRAQRVRGEVISSVLPYLLEPVIRHLFEFCIFSLLVLLDRSQRFVLPLPNYGLTYAAGWHTREA